LQYDLNQRALDILNLAKEYSKDLKISTMGSEFLILAMFETKDSLCHFLLSEYECDRNEIEEVSKNIFILRKKDGEINLSLETILSQAKMLSGDSKIGDEHIFMSILMNKNTIACSILEMLNLNIEELIIDVKEIYDFNAKDELSFVKNISKKAKNNELSTFVNRDEYLNRIDIIMNRRYKNNPLLIGNAGVGKTAIVEGYAMMLDKKDSDITILSLNLTSMLAGTRYRGDFEERFDKFVREIACKENVVIFIDEIHTIMGAATTEGNLDVANMLKPFLARNDIRLIGATTLDEYHKSILTDKALCRRFQPVFVSEPTLDETKEILFGIREDYEDFHNCHITDEVLEYLIYQSDKKIARRFRPDKCIDILDDVMSINQLNHKYIVSKNDVDNAIYNFNGNKIKSKDFNSNFKQIDKYRWLYEMDLLDKKPLLKILYKGITSGLDLLIEDLMSLFQIGEEAVLDIDLSGYKESIMLSSLIGAPPGYVGYNDDGVLTKHLVEYPMSIIVFKGYDKACGSIKAFIYNMISKGNIIDHRGKIISLANTIVVVEGIKEKINVGFTKSEESKDNLFDEEIIYNGNKNVSLNNKYINALSRINYEISFDFDINSDNYKDVNNYLYEFVKNNDCGIYEVKKNELNKIV
jgi:ATP-dependent Clp protease ATP-binding subunit ClpA